MLNSKHTNKDEQSKQLNKKSSIRGNGINKAKAEQK